jgi:hypothetical protein
MTQASQTSIHNPNQHFSVNLDHNCSLCLLDAEKMTTLSLHAVVAAGKRKIIKSYRSHLKAVAFIMLLMASIFLILGAKVIYEYTQCTAARDQGNEPECCRGLTSNAETALILVAYAGAGAISCVISIQSFKKYRSLYKSQHAHHETLVYF